MNANFFVQFARRCSFFEARSELYYRNCARNSVTLEKQLLHQFQSVRDEMNGKLDRILALVGTDTCSDKLDFLIAQDAKCAHYLHQ